MVGVPCGVFFFFCSRSGLRATRPSGYGTTSGARWVTSKKQLRTVFCDGSPQSKKLAKDFMSDNERLCDWTGICSRKAFFTLFSNPTPATKKDSIVDRVSAMEFCFIYGKCPIFALLPLISAVLRAFFLLEARNPPFSASVRQKWRILYRSRVQSFRDWF